jgi:hypothetical protein
MKANLAKFSMDWLTKRIRKQKVSQIGKWPKSIASE